MLHIDNLTLGNELKNDQGEVYMVTSNFSDGKKIYVEIEKKVIELKEGDIE